MNGKTRRIKVWVLTTKRGKFRVAVPTLKDAELHAYNDPIYKGVVVIRTPLKAKRKRA